MFSVSFAGPGIGLGLVTAGLDYNTVYSYNYNNSRSVTHMTKPKLLH